MKYIISENKLKDLKHKLVKFKINYLDSKVNKNDLLVLPGVWFNSEWGFEGTSCNPFQNVGNVELFDGAFAWHWHNRWDEPVQDGSKFEIIEKKNNELFKNLI